ncbi:MAG: efflux RND transporter permease subunit [Desulfuromonadales bacterium]|nr:efflux RND transporter permease subunit [Desulfuromonadales bacterium]
MVQQTPTAVWRQSSRVFDASLLDHCFEHRQRGKTFIEAAIQGTTEVAVPITFAILTTVAAFMPLLFVSGMMGKLITVVPAIVISLLVVSLIECLFILPAHLAQSKKRTEELRGIFGAIDQNRKRFSTFLDRFVSGPFLRALEFNLHNRYLSVAVGVAALVLTIGVVRGGVIKFTFMPEVEGDQISATIQMHQGVPIEETTRVVQSVESAAREVVAEFDRKASDERTILRGIYSLDGASAATGGPTGGDGSAATHLGSVSLLLTRSENRTVSTTDIRRAWQEKIGVYPGVRSLTLSSNLVRMGANIDVQLAHDDYAVLELASERLRTTLGEYPGVSDIEDTYAKGKRGLKLKLSDAGRSLGLTEANLARQVRSAFYGSEALRLQRRRNEVKVMVRYPDGDQPRLRHSVRNRHHSAADSGALSGAR